MIKYKDVTLTLTKQNRAANGDKSIPTEEDKKAM